MARLKYWVWLSCVDGVRPLVKYRLADAVGPEKLFYASEREMTDEFGVPEREAKHLADKSMVSASRAMGFCEEHGISILTLQDAQYPERLRNIPDPPVVLYVWGKLPPVDERAMIAVVGTRHATPYGITMAARLGEEIAAAGGVVVSGLAEGCDAAAMEAALRAGGVTVGVLGTAIDKVYPAKHRRLFESVRARGALVSEYPPGMRTYPMSFHARNRIIAGLSLGVAVAEAPIKSGTRVTAGFALEQGRDVFAVPGNADAEAAAGCNALIAEGAVVVTGGREIMEYYAHRTELSAQSPAKSVLKEVRSGSTHIKKEIDKPKDIVYIDTEKLTELPSAQRKILSVMTRPDMHADEIIETAGLSAPETLAGLTMLMVSGYVTQGAGKRYTRKK